MVILAGFQLVPLPALFWVKELLKVAGSAILAGLLLWLGLRD